MYNLVADLFVCGVIALILLAVFLEGVRFLAKDKSGLNIKIVGSLFLVAIMLLACTLAFQKMLADTIRRESEDKLIEVTRQSRLVVEGRIDAAWQDLYDIGSMLEKNDDGSLIDFFVSNTGRMSRFRYLGAVDVSGRAMYGSALPEKYLHFLQNNFRGEPDIRYLQAVYLPGGAVVEEGFLVSVPFFRDGIVAGAVYAILSDKEMESVFDTHSFGEEGFTFCSSAQFHRTILLHDADLKRRLILDAFVVHGNEPLVSELEWKMYHYNAGVEQFSFQGKEYYLSSVTIPKLQGWYMNTIVPAAGIDTTMNRISFTASVVELLLAALFLFAFWLIGSNERKADKAIKQLAFYDKVTGLLNWTGLKHSTSCQEGFVLAVFVYDDFNMVEEIKGKAYVENILQEAASWIASVMKDSEKVCCAANDRFAVYILEMELEARLEKLQSGLSCITGGQRMAVSCGYCLLADEQDMDIAYEHCCVALQSETSVPEKRRIVRFDLRLAIELQKYKSLENDLQAALRAGDIKILLRPEYSLSQNCWSGAEAVAIWQHAQLGDIEQDSFVSVLEHLGQLPGMELYVLNKVCEFLAAEKKTYAGGMRFAVQLSVAHFASLEAIDRLRSIIERQGVDLSCLEFALRGQDYSGYDVETVREGIRSLANAGCLVSMDGQALSLPCITAAGQGIKKLRLSWKFFNGWLKGGSQADRVKILKFLSGKGLMLSVYGVSIKQDDELRFNGIDTVLGDGYSVPLPPDEFFQLVKGGAGK